MLLVKGKVYNKIGCSSIQNNENGNYSGKTTDNLAPPVDPNINRIEISKITEHLVYDTATSIEKEWLTIPHVIVIFMSSNIIN